MHSAMKTWCLLHTISTYKIILRLLLGSETITMHVSDSLAYPSIYFHPTTPSPCGCIWRWQLFLRWLFCKYRKYYSWIFDAEMGWKRNGAVYVLLRRMKLWLHWLGGYIRCSWQTWYPILISFTSYHPANLERLSSILLLYFIKDML